MRQVPYTLCLDVGNSHLYGGLFQEEQLCLQFRHSSKEDCTSDQLGIFFTSVLRENKINPELVSHIGISSVVPSLDYSLGSAFIKYFKKSAFFLQPGVKTGLHIRVKNPSEVGSDRIATSMAATALYPNQNIIVIDIGTATTFDVITAENEFLGGVIMAGIKMSMASLHVNTAKLPPVRIIKPVNIVGDTTTTNIQSGLYYGQLGAFKEMITRIETEVFQQQKPIVIGTGGFASLFEKEGIFTKIIPDLVLQGIRLAISKNQ